MLPVNTNSGPACLNSRILFKLASFNIRMPMQIDKQTGLVTSLESLNVVARRLSEAYIQD